jgi:uncharacterized protein YqgC (DUF456 family)
MNTIASIITLIILIILLFVSLAPIIPAIPLIFVVMIIYGLADKFQHLTPLFLGGMLIITIISLFLDNIAAALGARQYGASKYGLWGALIGAFAGFFMNPVLGIIIGPFAGAVLAELIFTRCGWGRALKTGLGTLLGFAYGSAIRFILALAMVIGFILKVY